MSKKSPKIHNSIPIVGIKTKYYSNKTVRLKASHVNGKRHGIEVIDIA